MNEYTLLEMIGESPDEYVQEASMNADLHGVNEDKAKANTIKKTEVQVQEKKKESKKIIRKKTTHRFANWRKLQSAMILVALILTGVIVTGVYRAITRNVGMTSYESAVCADGMAPLPESAPADAIAGTANAETVDVYYVKDGTLQTKSVTLEMTSENIFEAWKEANGIGNEVKILSCEIVSNGQESISCDGDTSVAEYSVGEYFILNVTIGAEIRKYFSDQSEALMKESLEKTFRENDFIEYDEFHLTIQ